MVTLWLSQLIHAEAWLSQAQNGRKLLLINMPNSINGGRVGIFTGNNNLQPM